MERRRTFLSVREKNSNSLEVFHEPKLHSSYPFTDHLSDRKCYSSFGFHPHLNKIPTTDFEIASNFFHSQVEKRRADLPGGFFCQENVAVVACFGLRLHFIEAASKFLGETGERGEETVYP